MDVSRLERMGRRRFMENLAGVGVSATTLQYLEQDDLREITEDPEDEVPFVSRIRTIDEDGESVEEPIYDTIERNEWERRNAALDVRDTVSTRLEEEFPNSEVYAGFGNIDGSPTDFGVRVTVEDPKLSRKDIEGIVDTNFTGSVQGTEYQGIPVIVEEVDVEELAYQYTDFEPVPGGQRIDSPNVGIGTLMGQIESNQYGSGWVTAGHVAGTEDKITWEELDDKNDDGLGDVRELVDDGIVDCAFIEGELQNPAYSITNGDNTEVDLDVVGYFPDSALNNYADDSDPLQVAMQGQATGGRETGNLTDTVGSPTQAVKVDYGMQSGDSGGPMFWESGDEAWYVGTITDANLIGTVTRGTTIETVMDELNLSMNP